MAKRNFAALIGLMVCGLLSSNASAREIPVSVDGCAVLARAVYSEVSAAALYGPGRSGPWVIESRQGDVALCTTAAKTVSRAFTSAMNSAGFDVRWNRGGNDPGDYCWSGFLSQCYPNRNRLPTAGYGGNSAFVQKTWSAVSQSVMRQMYNPFSSDEVRFRPNDLKLRIGLSLRTIDRLDTR